MISLGFSLLPQNWTPSNMARPHPSIVCQGDVPTRFRVPLIDRSDLWNRRRCAPQVRGVDQELARLKGQRHFFRSVGGWKNSGQEHLRSMISESGPVNRWIGR